MKAWEVVRGDALEVLAAMEPASVDSIVCDPPYGLEFMGRDWDRFREDDQAVPGYNGRRAGVQGVAGIDKGNHPAGRAAVVYGGGQRPTTSRCEGCGKRDQFRKPHSCPDGTGWRRELIDPHAASPSMLAFQAWCREWGRLALRVLKPGGWLLAFGGTRTEHRLKCGLEDAGFEVRDTIAWLYGQGFPKSLDLGDGWGTALKPAHEPIAVARKPFAATVAGNMLEHGTGALNVDGCRIGIDGGRWPPNVVLDPEAAAMLDAQGGASRFFYCAKASTAERNALELSYLPRARSPRKRGHQDLADTWRARARNRHPTVKPIELMRWLVRLVTRPGGLVVDPFAGSCTTGAAAVLEGLRFLGIERDIGSAIIGRARVAWWADHPDGMEFVRRLELEAERAAVVAAGQGALFQ